MTHRPSEQAPFSRGRCVATPSAMEDTTDAERNQFITRHLQGDWGDIPAEDARANERAIEDGARIISCYTAESRAVIWVITEADRSATTLLLRDEY